MGDIASMTVGQLQLGYRKVEKIDIESVALNAFIKILDTNKSGIAVVAQNVFNQEEVVGNISASDLKNIGNAAELFSILYLPITSFLSRNTKTNHSFTNSSLNPPQIPPPLTVNTNNTLASVLWIFCLHKIHRIFVVDLDQQLIGVITPSDILRLFVSPEHFGI